MARQLSLDKAQRLYKGKHAVMPAPRATDNTVKPDELETLVQVVNERSGCLGLLAGALVLLAAIVMVAL